jgi:hypothetical protein
MFRVSTQLARLGSGVLLGLFTAWLVVAPGCAKPVGDVSGKVTVKGQNLEYGTVTYMASDGTGYQGEIQPDGSYSIKGIPLGAAKIAVTSIDPEFTNKMKAQVEKMRNQKEKPTLQTDMAKYDISKYRKAPEKYGNPESSELQFDVKPGQNKKDIDIN